MTIKYQRRGTSVIWKNNTFLSAVVHPSDLWAEGGQKNDAAAGGWTRWRGQKYALSLLHYKLNEKVRTAFKETYL